MIRPIMILAVIFFLSNDLYSQPIKKSWELSFSGNMGSVSSSYSGQSNSSQFIALTFHPGFFVTENIEIEPEIQWLAADGDKPLLSYSANVAYNFGNPPSTKIPFILLGFGRTNSIPFNRTLLFRSSDKHDISILNVGAGMKFLAAKNVAFRMEYRHQSFTYSRSFGNTTNKYSTKYNQMLFGFSIFFKT
ncbi:MAG: outer membrane beta-barrel protein [candidate division Zixibacteria bacterium]